VIGSKTSRFAAGALIAVAVSYKSGIVARSARASGTTADDLKRPLPGDDLVAGATTVMDRVAVLPHSAEEIWPWIVQLGKQRGRWYMPRSVEPFLVPIRSKRGAREIVSEFQDLAVGDHIPDYGPEGQFEVASIDRPRALVYRSLRPWPLDEPWPEPNAQLPDKTLAFSWAIVVDELAPSQTRVHLRLRAKRGQSDSASKPLTLFGGLVDYVTVALMFAGLRERLADSR
jgi:hypothetical protein